MNGFPAVPFPEPIDPPTTEPDAAPFVNPAYNADWNKYLLGVIGALLSPETWVGDDSAKTLAVKRANNLMDIFAGAPGIVQFRQTDCDLEVSFDNGDTWTAVFSQCADDDSAYVLLVPSGSYNDIRPAAGVNALRIFPIGAAYGLDVQQARDYGNPVSGIPAMRSYGIEGAALHLRSTAQPLLDTDSGEVINASGMVKLLHFDSGTFEHDAAYRGEMLLLSNEDGSDRAVIVLKTAGSDYVLSDLKGDTGAAGADGAGITSADVSMLGPNDAATADLTNDPDVQHQNLALGIPQAPTVTEVTATGLSAGSSPTVTETTRTDGDLKLAFGIPAGATGATGAQGQISFPDLPDGGADPVTFEMIILEEGSSLPWILPAGYKFQVMSAKGLWTVKGDDLSFYIVGKDGSGSHNEANGIPTGRVLATLDSVDTAGVASTDTTADATSEQLLSFPRAVTLAGNSTDEAAGNGYLVAQVKVTPTTAAPIGYYRRSHNGTDGSEVWDDANWVAIIDFSDFNTSLEGSAVDSTSLNDSYARIYLRLNSDGSGTLMNHFRVTFNTAGLTATHASVVDSQYLDTTNTLIQLAGTTNWPSSPLDMMRYLDIRAGATFSLSLSFHQLT